VTPGCPQVLGCFLMLTVGLLVGASTPAELNRRGVEFLKKGDYTRALEQFRAAAAVSPKEAAIQLNIGLTLYRMGRLREALQPLEASLHGPTAAQARYLRGMVLFQLGEFPAAAVELEPLRAAAAQGEQVLYMLVESHRITGNARRSQEAFLELQRRYPESALLNKLMGVAYEWQGDDTNAMGEFREALRKSPRLPDVSFAVGYLYFKQRSFAEARWWFKQELSQDACYSKAHYYLGEIESAEERYDAAAAHYRKAIKCEPRYAEPYLGLGKALERTGDVQQAVTLYRQAVRLKPQSFRGHYVLGRALRQIGERKESEAELAIAKKLGEEASERMPMLTRSQD
jgi:tetratricopeptide (TPR) repeat protein